MCSADAKLHHRSETAIVMMQKSETRPMQVALYAASGVIALHAPFIGFLAPELAWPLAVVQAAWAVGSALCGWLLGRTEQPAAIASAVAIACPVFFAPLVWATGAHASPAFGWLIALPLAFVVLFRSLTLPVALGGISCVLATLALVTMGRAPLPIAGLRLTQVAGAAVLAAVGAAAFKAAREREHLAEGARETALKALSDSELARERNERFAQLGQLAGSLMHEVNNPLSFIKSNLEYLRQSHGTTEEGQGAIDDALQGVERIRAVVAELKELARHDEQHFVVKDQDGTERIGVPLTKKR